MGVMKILLFLLLAAQDNLDNAIRSLPEKLSKEGISGRLADAATSDAGIQAIREKVDFLLAARISRFERDAVGHLEDYLFTVDELGDLRLRPERRSDLEALVKRLPFASRAMSGFSRKADDLVRRLGDSELDKRARAAWSDPVFRTAFFHRHPELRELDDAEQVAAVGLHRRDEQLEAIKPYEKSYLQLVAQVDDAGTRKVLAGDTALLVLVGRVVRQSAEGAAVPIGALEEEKISFTKPLAELLPLVKDVEAILPRLSAVEDPRSRVLIAERIVDLQEEQKRKCEEIMAAVLEDGFTADGDRLSVKKDRYESPDALTAELDGIIAEFHGTMRQDFDRIAERCLDPDVIALFEDKPGTYLLAEFRDRVIAALAHEIRTSGFDVFLKTYLVKKGDVYVVRPERALRVEAILKRAADITAGK